MLPVPRRRLGTTTQPQAVYVSADIHAVRTKLRDALRACFPTLLVLLPLLLTLLLLTLLLLLLLLTLLLLLGRRPELEYFPHKELRRGKETRGRHRRRGPRRPLGDDDGERESGLTNSLT